MLPLASPSATAYSPTAYHGSVPTCGSSTFFAKRSHSRDKATLWLVGAGEGVPPPALKSAQPVVITSRLRAADARIRTVLRMIRIELVLCLPSFLVGLALQSVGFIGDLPLLIEHELRIF